MGCGGDGSGSVAGPLPLGERDPRAYDEAFLARNPDASLQPGHVAVVRLRPGDGGGLACGDGMVCVPYHFTRPTELRVSLHDSAQELSHVHVIDPSGALRLEVRRESAAPAVVVQPGRHVVRLHHRQPGEVAAAEETLYLRPPAAPADGATAGGVERAAIEASADCAGCNFYCATFRNTDFSGSNLDAADFRNADLREVLFVDASLRAAQFQLDFLTPFQCGDEPGGGLTRLDVVDFSGADLTGARFDGASGVAPRFTGARLTRSVWEAYRVGVDESGTNFIPVHLTDADFRGATAPSLAFVGAVMDGADFRGVALGTVVFTPVLGVDDAVDLDGNPILPSCRGCRFGADPSGGPAAQLRNAVFDATDLGGADFRGADLTDAVFLARSLDGALFAGAMLSGADLISSSLVGASFAGTELAGRIDAQTFNQHDLTRTDFRGVDFSGFDLTRADLSKSIIDVTTRFAGARLSDGVGHGVVLAGHRFAAQTEQFKGLDLSFTDFSRATLEAADLEGAILRAAQLVGANLTFANLHQASLIGAHLGVAPGSGAEATNLRGALMTDIDLTGADLRSANLTEAHLYGDVARTLLVGTMLDSAVLDGAIVSGAVFSGSLTDASFNNAQAINTIFNGANLTNAKFDDAYLQGADFSAASSVTGISLVNAVVATAPGSWTYMEQDGTPFVFPYGATALGALATDPTVRCPSGDSGPCGPEQLVPERSGPFPPQPPCIPRPPRYDNCLPPAG
jgi:uncharacterized protein YjbI with pentapeptide repeats